MQKFCELCSQPFDHPKNRFCSVKCRNTHNGLVRQVKPTDRIFRTCPTCGHEGFRVQPFCNKHFDRSTIRYKPFSRRRVWSKERDAYVIKHYPTQGAAEVAKALGLKHNQVLNRAFRLEVTLTKAAAHRLVYSPNKQYMIENNPMFRQEPIDKVKQHYIDNPGKRAAVMENLFEGHRRMQKGNPTKLEIKLLGILDGFGVDYSPFYLVKPKFIVDVKIGDLIIQADGDYWHGHPRFESLTDRQKAQQKRDKAQDKYLTACGYAVERIWECDMTKDAVGEVLARHNLI